MEEPRQRFKVGPGGVVEQLEEAPPSREEDAKNLPVKHVSGKSIERSNSSSGPLMQTNSTEPLDKANKKRINSNNNNNKSKELDLSRTIVGVAIVFFAFIFVDKFFFSIESDSEVMKVIPETDETMLVDEGQSVFVWITEMVVGFAIIVIKVIEFILRIVLTILGV